MMSPAEKFELWDSVEVKKLNENTFVVVNNKTGIAAVKKIMDKSMYDIHKQLSEINCDNLIKIYDADIIDDKCVVLEEYVAGQTIEDIVSRGGCFSSEQTAKYMLKLCDGLECMHSHNIIHRDISPSNIMITNTGNVKIIDFGISRIPKFDEGKDTRILGTVGYAAPEQFGFTQTDCKSDIYAVGALMNYMLTGHLPNEETATGPLYKVVRKCTQLAPENRYESVKKLRFDIYETVKQQKNILRRIIRKIPGFRGNNTVAAILAVYYYISAGCMTIAFLNFWKTDPLKELEMIGRFAMLFALPFVFYTDFLDLSLHLPLLKKLPKKTRRIIFFSIATVIQIIGIALLATLSVPE